MISEETLVLLGRSLPALQSLPEPTRRLVRGEAASFSLPPGRSVFDIDSECPGFLTVLGGIVRVVQPLPSGREILLYRIRSGGTCVLTASCILGSRESPARGITETMVHGVYLGRALFQKLVQELPDFRAEIFQTLGNRLVELMALVEEITVRRMDQRLARRLVTHVESSADRTIRRTHRELADELGTSREIVSRLLETFESRELVALGRRRIDVLKPDSLARLASAPLD